jgi:hypothetical protein
LGPKMVHAPVFGGDSLSVFWGTVSPMVVSCACVDCKAAETRLMAEIPDTVAFPPWDPAKKSCVSPGMRENAVYGTQYTSAADARGRRGLGGP